jgi:hypothetical protein
MKIDWKILFEAVKEPLREIVLAAIPGILVYLQTIPASWAIIVYLVLRGIDKYLHEAKIFKTGIVPF